MSRVGILGSLFHPPHMGHLRLAETATTFLALDTLLFVPTAFPPHKSFNDLWGYEVRVFLTKIAFCLEPPEELEISAQKLGKFPPTSLASLLAVYRRFYHPCPGWKLWEAEKEKTKPAYTIDTLKKYKLDHPEDEIFLLIGQDEAAVFHTWKRYEEIFSLAQVCVGTRPHAAEFPDMPFVKLPPFEVDVSSTKVREAWLKGENLSGLVPETVQVALESLATNR
ncbi:nicotinate-nicotinamide nucleotide adenylyltransferase [Thermospira aquatica]|uniref:Probable nicotinate-nucleotide adenylyltransferase n=1 Tax=Thermospira aquatica TaxID=2828656 RepID=A0AAX3BDM4_9SPIR|nr:nicotinate-nicotinamide nucleotide adenylyltransferase [Thermospira aquatica]URA10432.1 nicotinate-nicotinamide nucleotide adenylyltransferase [Thermospira aquatica]